MEPITLMHPDLIDTACERDMLPVHDTTECAAIHTLTPGTEDARCSACELPWGRGLVSQHESCAELYADGSRRAAHPRTYWTRQGETVEIVREELP